MLGFLATAGLPATANASQAAMSAFVPDTTLQRFDKVPPSKPVLSVKRIVRGRGTIHFTDGKPHIGPGETGSIQFAVSVPGHDPQIAHEFGFRIHMVDGRAPWPFVRGESWTTPIVGDGSPFIEWTDGATWDQDPFCFRVYVTAIDRAGNESVPSNVIVVEHDGFQEERYARTVIVWERLFRDRDALRDLDGHWVGHDGEGHDASLVVRDGAFSLAVGRETILGGLQVHTKDFARPNNGIDLWIHSLGSLITREGIYELKGSTLSICLAGPDGARPAKWTSPVEGTVYVLARRPH